MEISATLLPTLVLPHDTVSCEFLLPSQYPLSPPVLICHTPFLTPSIADGRDLLEEVLEGPWRKDTNLKGIMQAFPRFLVNFMQEKAENVPKSPEKLNLIGRFLVGKPHYLRLWEGKGNIGLFSAQELDPLHTKSVRRVTLIVTELTLLLIQPVKSASFAYLLSAIPITSLDSCSFSHSEPHKITFNYRSGVSQLLSVNEALGCVDLISSNLYRLGVQRQRQIVHPVPTLGEEEVGRSAVSKVKIEKILVEIGRLEGEVAVDAKMETINKLMTLIQQAIEYFSAVDDPKHEEYLEKIHTLLGSDSVQRLLTAMDDSSAIR